MLLVAATAGFAVSATAAAPVPSKPPGETIGLVLTMERPGHWESHNAQVECPEGLQHTEKDNWNALDESVREARSRHFGHRWNRGPNGENSTALPWAIEDPLPYKEVRSELAHGFDLDGTTDGSATATYLRAPQVQERRRAGTGGQPALPGPWVAPRAGAPPGPRPVTG